jgi:predicted nucleic acid-binding protein
VTSAVDPPTLVVDASVLVNALTMRGDDGHHVRGLLKGNRLAAPEQLMVETLHAIRGRLLSGKLTVADAELAVRDLGSTTVELVPTRLLLPRMWELRDNLSGYDAAYVAAAGHLGVPLVTADKRLAAAAGVRCEVRIP